MRFVVISDTHGMHGMISLPSGDAIIHCGDFCNIGTMNECIRFFGWFNALPFKHRIVIAGNHDIAMDLNHPDSSLPSFGCVSESTLGAIIPQSEGFHYLNDSGCEIVDDKNPHDTIKIWGSPVQPRFFNWAFNRDRGEDIRKHWDLIPSGIDILVTHGPSAGFNDECPDFRVRGKMVNVGCEDLKEALKRVKPKVHCCGHVHYGHGSKFDEDTLHINASICNESYAPINKAQVFDLCMGEVIPVSVT